MVPGTRPIVALGEVLWDLLPSGPRAGGAPFNFAFHCQQLGHPAIIVSRVGDDQLGHDLRAEVRRLGMSDEYIQTDRDHPTGTVNVAVDAGGQPSYTIAENVAWDFLEWESRLDDLAERARAICFGTLAQRSRTTQTVIHAFISASAEETLTVCDLNLRPPFDSTEAIKDSLRLTDWLKLNEWEAGQVIGLLSLDPRPWLGGGSDYYDRLLMPAILNDRAVLAVTGGHRGCFVSNAFEVTGALGIPIKVADTVGAGDAFTAALLTQHLEGKPLAEAARFANAYAAIVASKPGGTPRVERAEVERLLSAKPQSKSPGRPA